jgi:sulfur-carrier protein
MAVPIAVELCLYAYLRRYLPEAKLGEGTPLDVDEGTTLTALLDTVGIPREARGVVFVNGVVEREDRSLAAGDRIAVFPPIAGGA